MPSTRAGLRQEAASSVTDSEEVLDATMNFGISARDLVQDLFFEVHQLRYRLDDHVGAVGARGVGIESNSPPGIAGLGLGELALADRLGHRRFDAPHGALEDRGVDVAQNGIEPRLGADFGDTGAHRAGADDDHSLNLFGAHSLAAFLTRLSKKACIRRCLSSVSNSTAWPRTSSVSNAGCARALALSASLLRRTASPP